MGKKKLLSGNEAIARGFYEYGGEVATAYPGTPSTEILENISQYKEVNCRWSVNEKVAFEVATGASIGGVRTLTAMKHVGLNVAADPLMTFAYEGVNGGFIVVSADDPGMHSSQNEQDSRRFAIFAKIPVLNPASSQEAKDFVKLGYEISEKFDTPVMLRVTTRISHSKGLVEVGDRTKLPLKEYVKDIKRNMMLPAHARPAHIRVEERLKAVQEFANTASNINFIEWGDLDVGFITSGIAYQYTKEVFPKASVLKIGMDFPFPDKLTKEFVSKVKKVYVIEELEPILEEQCKLMGLNVEGKSIIPITFELNQQILRDKFNIPYEVIKHDVEVPVRPPVLCPGCPHRPVFYALRRLKLVVTGDIGCYTLGAYPPLNAMDTCLCMGGSITQAIGLELAQGKEFSKKLVGVLGDSTFFHSGVTGLMEAAYNKTNTTTIILDNSITAMTGLQENPGTAKTLMGEETKTVDIPALVKSIGINHCAVVHSYDLEEVQKTIKEAVEKDEASVVITKARCVLISKKTDHLTIDKKLCINCGVCVKTGCPAIYIDDEKQVRIDADLCYGSTCKLCLQVCKQNAPTVVTGKGA